ncbi:2-hydroxychromene-2-carboxylate isomerase [Arhodomonas sp. SL1]|uniref:2-hydroxychromene-2-carboxylate isomerase n=1 Tax=Arhodomonas sp. SL1 TaxID=3425691 RepID=UPI003F883A20
MSRSIDYYFFMISPFAYLGSRELERIAGVHAARVNVKPVKVQTVFQETGGVPPAQRAKPRQDYRFIELERWSRERGLPITLEPKYFPVNDDLAAGAVHAANATGGDPLALAHALLAACWAGERDVSDPPTVREIAEATGHDGAQLMDAATGEAAQQAFQTTTREAIDRGVFGSPWYIVEGEPFWGQDRLDFVERKLAQG